MNEHEAGEFLTSWVWSQPREPRECRCVHPCWSEPAGYLCEGCEQRMEEADERAEEQALLEYQDEAFDALIEQGEIRDAERVR